MFASQFARRVLAEYTNASKRIYQQRKCVALNCKFMCVQLLSVRCNLSYCRYAKIRSLKFSNFRNCSGETTRNTNDESSKSQHHSVSSEALLQKSHTVGSSDSTLLKDAEIKVIPRKKDIPGSSSYMSRERNFITTIRAMGEFLLTPSNLEKLRKTKRRSPFENEPPITVYWRKDVEAKALELWGSFEELERERRRRQRTSQTNQEYMFKLRNFLRKQDVMSTATQPPSASIKAELDASGKVVWAAVVINGVNLVMKLGAWAFTGSHSLFAEALHSFADVTNQLILAYGIHKSHQQANSVHPYGYTTMRYVSSLVSGAMIFCVGAGLSFQHGITGLLHPTEVVPLYWAFYILGGSLITEGGTLLMAFHTIRKGAQRENMTFMQYVLQGHDPSVNVVLLEDLAAVVGVVVCLSCMGLTSLLGSHVPDAVGSCLIGGLLAGVSGFIVYTNSRALVGRSIPQHQLNALNNELESDVMIRAIHDVKGIDMGTGLVRYKAEVDFDGRTLTKNYLEKHDPHVLLEELRSIETKEALEAFLLKHGENIVDSLGAEVDRIENTLKAKHPEIRHCDLEIL